MNAVGFRALDRVDASAGKEALFALILYADSLVGGRCTEDEIVVLTKAMYPKVLNLSLSFVAMAFRDGIATDKVYGKLTYDQLMRWVIAMQERVAEDNNEAYLSTRG